jgi:hypothetical protein
LFAGQRSALALALGILGSVVLFLGVFAPIVRVPIVGALNYFQNGKGDGVIVLILALASLVLALTNRYKWLWLTGVGVLATLAVTFLVFQHRMAQARSQMDTDLENNMFRGLAEIAMQSVQLEWGWAVLIVGGACLLSSAGVGGRVR